MFPSFRWVRRTQGSSKIRLPSKAITEHRIVRGENGSKMTNQKLETPT